MFSSSAWGTSGWRMFQRGLQQYKKNSQRNSRRFSAAGSGGTPAPGGASFLNNAVLKAGLISGSLSLVGDCVAQTLSNQKTQDASYDPARMARMFSFGLLFYGPFQHFWYRALDRSFPGRTVTNFLCKVSANQLLLAPIVISAVFAWTLALQGKSSELSDKMQTHFLSTMLTGWKFWVPAASINFVAVPLQHQVLYMSLCGVVWTAILSSSSAQVDHRAKIAQKKK